MYQVLVNEAKIAVINDKPVWADNEENIIQGEESAFGSKTDIDIIRPHMALVMDKVECNLSQDMDHVVGGQMFLTSVDGQACKSAWAKNHHFACLGLTRLYLTNFYMLTTSLTQLVTIKC